ncbi:hypothetical protein DIPPA_02882 [Diplonema papillatum]|nr:hypothetical protein DIPPA_02882 [Diplonema papillatum]
MHGGPGSVPLHRYAGPVPLSDGPRRDLPAARPQRGASGSADGAAAAEAGSGHPRLHVCGGARSTGGAAASRAQPVTAYTKLYTRPGLPLEGRTGGRSPSCRLSPPPPTPAEQRGGGVLRQAAGTLEYESYFNAASAKRRKSPPALLFSSNDAGPLSDSVDRRRGGGLPERKAVLLCSNCSPVRTARGQRALDADGFASEKTEAWPATRSAPPPAACGRSAAAEFERYVLERRRRHDALLRRSRELRTSIEREHSGSPARQRQQHPREADARRQQQQQLPLQQQRQRRETAARPSGNSGYCSGGRQHDERRRASTDRASDPDKMLHGCRLAGGAAGHSGGAARSSSSSSDSGRKRRRRAGTPETVATAEPGTPPRSEMSSDCSDGGHDEGRHASRRRRDSVARPHTEPDPPAALGARRRANRSGSGSSGSHRRKASLSGSSERRASRRRRDSVARPHKESDPPAALEARRRSNRASTGGSSESRRRETSLSDSSERRASRRRSRRALLRRDAAQQTTPEECLISAARGKPRRQSSDSSGSSASSGDQKRRSPARKDGRPSSVAHAAVNTEPPATKHAAKLLFGDGNEMPVVVLTDTADFSKTCLTAIAVEPASPRQLTPLQATTVRYASHTPSSSVGPYGSVPARLSNPSSSSDSPVVDRVTGAPSPSSNYTSRKRVSDPVSPERREPKVTPPVRVRRTLSPPERLVPAAEVSVLSSEASTADSTDPVNTLPVEPRLPPDAREQRRNLLNPRESTLAKKRNDASGTWSTGVHSPMPGQNVSIEVAEEADSPRKVEGWTDEADDDARPSFLVRMQSCASTPRAANSYPPRAGKESSDGVSDGFRSPLDDELFKRTPSNDSVPSSAFRPRTLPSRPQVVPSGSDERKGLLRITKSLQLRRDSHASSPPSSPPGDEANSCSHLTRSDTASTSSGAERKPLQLLEKQTTEPLECSITVSRAPGADTAPSADDNFREIVGARLGALEATNSSTQRTGDGTTKSRYFEMRSRVLQKVPSLQRGDADPASPKGATDSMRPGPEPATNQGVGSEEKSGSTAEHGSVLSGRSRHPQGTQDGDTGSAGKTDATKVSSGVFDAQHGASGGTAGSPSSATCKAPHDQTRLSAVGSEGQATTSGSSSQQQTPFSAAAHFLKESGRTSIRRPRASPPDAAAPIPTGGSSPETASEGRRDTFSVSVSAADEHSPQQLASDKTLHNAHAAPSSLGKASAHNSSGRHSSKSPPGAGSGNQGSGKAGKWLTVEGDLDSLEYSKTAEPVKLAGRFEAPGGDAAAKDPGEREKEKEEKPAVHLVGEGITLIVSAMPDDSPSPSESSASAEAKSRRSDAHDNSGGSAAAPSFSHHGQTADTARTSATRATESLQLSSSDPSPTGLSSRGRRDGGFVLEDSWTMPTTGILKRGAATPIRTTGPSSLVVSMNLGNTGISAMGNTGISAMGATGSSGQSGRLRRGSEPDTRTVKFDQIAAGARSRGEGGLRLHPTSSEMTAGNSTFISEMLARAGDGESEMADETFVLDEIQDSLSYSKWLETRERLDTQAHVAAIFFNEQQQNPSTPPPFSPVEFAPLAATSPAGTPPTPYVCESDSSPKELSTVGSLRHFQWIEPQIHGGAPFGCSPRVNQVVVDEGTVSTSHGEHTETESHPSTVVKMSTTAAKKEEAKEDEFKISFLELPGVLSDTVASGSAASPLQSPKCRLETTNAFAGTTSFRSKLTEKSNASSKVTSGGCGNSSGGTQKTVELGDDSGSGHFAAAVDDPFRPSAAKAWRPLRMQRAAVDNPNYPYSPPHRPKASGASFDRPSAKAGTPAPSPAASPTNRKSGLFHPASPFDAGGSIASTLARPLDEAFGLEFGLRHGIDVHSDAGTVKTLEPQPASARVTVSEDSDAEPLNAHPPAHEEAAPTKTLTKDGDLLLDLPRRGSTAAAAAFASSASSRDEGFASVASDTESWASAMEGSPPGSRRGSRKSDPRPRRVSPASSMQSCTSADSILFGATPERATTEPKAAGSSAPERQHPAPFDDDDLLMQSSPRNNRAGSPTPTHSVGKERRGSMSPMHTPQLASSIKRRTPRQDSPPLPPAHNVHSGPRPPQQSPTADGAAADLSPQNFSTSHASIPCSFPSPTNPLRSKRPHVSFEGDSPPHRHSSTPHEISVTGPPDLAGKSTSSYQSVNSGDLPSPVLRASRVDAGADGTDPPPAALPAVVGESPDDDCRVDTLNTSPLRPSQRSEAQISTLPVSSGGSGSPVDKSLTSGGDSPPLFKSPASPARSRPPLLPPLPPQGAGGASGLKIPPRIPGKYGVGNLGNSGDIFSPMLSPRSAISGRSGSSMLMSPRLRNHVKLNSFASGASSMNSQLAGSIAAARLAMRAGKAKEADEALEQLSEQIGTSDPLAARLIHEIRAGSIPAAPVHQLSTMPHDSLEKYTPERLAAMTLNMLEEHVRVQDAIGLWSDEEDDDFGTDDGALSDQFNDDDDELLPAGTLRFGGLSDQKAIDSAAGYAGVPRAAVIGKSYTINLPKARMGSPDEQDPENCRVNLAASLGIPAGRIRSVAPAAAGCFSFQIFEPNPQQHGRPPVPKAPAHAASSEEAPSAASPQRESVPAAPVGLQKKIEQWLGSVQGNVDVQETERPDDTSNDETRELVNRLVEWYTTKPGDVVQELVQNLRFPSSVRTRALKRRVLNRIARSILSTEGQMSSPLLNSSMRSNSSGQQPSLVEALVLRQYTQKPMDVDRDLGWPDVPLPPEGPSDLAGKLAVDEYERRYTDWDWSLHYDDPLRRNGSLFGPVCAALRDQGPGGARSAWSEAILRKWIKWLITVAAAVAAEKHTFSSLTLWRGLGAGGLPAEVVNAHRLMAPGTMLTWPALSSLSLHKSQSIAYMYGEAANARNKPTAERPGTILFSVENVLSGYLLSTLSQYPEEEELLLGPLMTFRVESVEDDAASPFGCGVRMKLRCMGLLACLEIQYEQEQVMGFFVSAREDARIASTALLRSGTASRAAELWNRVRERGKWNASAGSRWTRSRSETPHSFGDL